MSEIGQPRILANYQPKINGHGTKLSLRSWRPSRNTMFTSLQTYLLAIKLSHWVFDLKSDGYKKACLKASHKLRV